MSTLSAYSCTHSARLKSPSTLSDFGDVLLHFDNVPRVVGVPSPVPPVPASPCGGPRMSISRSERNR